jgi:hypothetical protein
LQRFDGRFDGSDANEGHEAVEHTVMPETIRTLTADEALAMAERQGGRAPEVARRLAPDGKLVLGRFGLAERDAFLDIAWQELATKTRHLTAGSERTLAVVATAIVDRFGSFAALVAADPQTDLDPEWFRTCAEIEGEGFDFSKWLSPWLAPAIAADGGSPTTTWYVWEGVHSIIVLAVGLIRGDIDWQPVDAVLCLDRP